MTKNQYLVNEIVTSLNTTRDSAGRPTLIGAAVMGGLGLGFGLLEGLKKLTSPKKNQPPPTPNLNPDYQVGLQTGYRYGYIDGYTTGYNNAKAKLAYPNEEDLKNPTIPDLTPNINPEYNKAEFRNGFRVGYQNGYAYGYRIGYDDARSNYPYSSEPRTR